MQTINISTIAALAIATVMIAPSGAQSQQQSVETSIPGGMMGYGVSGRGMMGMNISADQTQQIRVDYPGVDLWIQNWCQAHATDSLIDAVTAFKQAHQR